MGTRFTRRTLLTAASVFLGDKLLNTLAKPVGRWEGQLRLEAAQLPGAGDQAGVSPVTFVDVAKEAGVTVENVWGGVTHKDYIIEAKGCGIAFFDYDQDGWLDIYLTNGTRLNTTWPPGQTPHTHLLKNNRDGTFTDVTEKSGLARSGWQTGVCVGDYDNDGWDDIFLTFWGHNVLFHNNGDGTFTQVNSKEVFPPVLGKGMGIAVADFLGDGKLGFFVANDHARNLLFRSNGHGFEEMGIEAGVAYNSDGRSISGMGAAFGDVNGDGRPDLVMTGLKNETYELFLNQGGGVFDDGSAASGLLALSLPWSGWGCGLVDLDNDGWLDLFIACGGLEPKDAQPNRVLHNSRGKFSDVSDASGRDFARPGLYRGVVFADFDRDGRMDAAVTALNQPIELWWNRTPRRHWIQLRLHGKRSNRSAIGAKVICKTATQTQIRCVTNSVGYASSSDLAVHFGLGADSSAVVEIRWPSGAAQKLGVLKADQHHIVEEPA